MDINLNMDINFTGAIHLYTKHFNTKSKLKITDNSHIELVTIRHDQPGNINGIDRDIDKIHIGIAGTIYNGIKMLRLYVHFSYDPHGVKPGSYLGNLIIPPQDLQFNGYEFRFNPSQVALDMANYPSEEYRVILTEKGAKRFYNWLLNNAFIV